MKGRFFFFLIRKEKNKTTLPKHLWSAITKVHICKFSFEKKKYLEFEKVDLL